jgi:hypothetical protein
LLVSEADGARAVRYRVTAVAAERRLEFHPAEGLVLAVTIRLGVPRRDRKYAGGNWVCPYDITGFPKTRRRWAFGIDGVQALSLAYHVIPAELRRLAQQAGGGRFTFLRADGIAFADGCGLLLNDLVDEAVTIGDRPRRSRTQT